jgi:hypothetical protein
VSPIIDESERIMSNSRPLFLPNLYNNRSSISSLAIAKDLSTAFEKARGNSQKKSLNVLHDAFEGNRGKFKVWQAFMRGRERSFQFLSEYNLSVSQQGDNRQLHVDENGVFSKPVNPNYFESFINSLVPADAAVAGGGGAQMQLQVEAGAEVGVAGGLLQLQQPQPLPLPQENPAAEVEEDADVEGEDGAGFAGKDFSRKGWSKTGPRQKSKFMANVLHKLINVVKALVHPNSHDDIPAILEHASRYARSGLKQNTDRAIAAKNLADSPLIQRLVQSYIGASPKSQERLGSGDREVASSRRSGDRIWWGRLIVCRPFPPAAPSHGWEG